MFITIEVLSMSALLNYRRPFGGVLHDLSALRSRWWKDWARVVRLLPLLGALQFSVQLLCHTLLLLQLASFEIRYVSYNLTSS